MQGNKLVDIVKDGEWHWQLIHAWLSGIILNKIVAIFPSNESNGYDIHVYKDDIDGRFSISDKSMNIGGLIQEHRVNVGWKPPKEGWVCLNVDGACQNGVIGCGGVIRGSDEEWLGDFSNFIRRGEVYVTEL
ncbi:hypothetical protein KIW84_023967 [Lathyrus oleraceus]|uniref:RNase H type-1 domain-containing protein n=1 Tax=Pisum sativum TaxID=3888 RepID=A0A9D5BBT5_PEA|nr:hypothetical protein KIW84_023967 [Pisum sativum]